MLGREVRFSKQHNDECVGMLEAEFSNFVGSVPVAGANFAQIFARHAIQSKDGSAAVAGGAKQFVKWRPVISPVEIETDTLAQFAFVNLLKRPFVEDVLVACKNGFNAQHNRALIEFEIAKQRA